MDAAKRNWKPFSTEGIMLVLSRREGETIKIGDGIEITVTEIKSGRVRLGVKAPKDVAISREELVDEIEIKGKGTGRIGG